MFVVCVQRPIWLFFFAVPNFILSLLRYCYYYYNNNNNHNHRHQCRVKGRQGLKLKLQNILQFLLTT